MGRLILGTIVLVIISLTTTLFMGGGYAAAAVIHDMGLTYAHVAWVGVLLSLALVTRIVIRKYRDYRDSYSQQPGQHQHFHHGGHP